MSFIAKLKLVSSKRERNLSPIMMRRQKLATKIEEQLELARCQKNGTLFAPKRLKTCLLYTSPSPRDRTRSRMPSSA